MTLRRLISLSLALFVWQNAEAQLAPADDFFNSGAQFYISNNIPSALKRVESGLQIYPDDEKLKKLEQLLKQKQQQQKQQQNQSKNNQQKNQQNQQGQSQPQKNQQSQQKHDEQKQKQADQKKAAPQQPQAEPAKKQAGEGQPAKPGEMTPAEAKRLLDEQKGNEQVLQFKPPGKPQDDQRSVKDW